MKQFNIEIDEKSSKTNQFTTTAGEAFSVLVHYRNWTVNKTQWNLMLVNDGDELVTEKIVALSDNDILHICTPLYGNTRIHFRNTVAPSLATPADIIQAMVETPSVQCNSYTYMEQSIAPTVTEASLVGPLEVNLNMAYAAWNKMNVNLGQSSTAPEVKIVDKDGNAVVDVQGWIEKTVAGHELKASGKQLHVNVDRLTLNGTRLAVKELTVGDTTLSVLAAVPE